MSRRRRQHHLPTVVLAAAALTICVATLAVLLLGAIELWVIVPLRLIQHATEVAHP